jgi:hypothetical protein
MSLSTTTALRWRGDRPPAEGTSSVHLASDRLPTIPKAESVRPSEHRPFRTGGAPIARHVKAVRYNENHDDCCGDRFSKHRSPLIVSSLVHVAVLTSPTGPGGLIRAACCDRVLAGQILRRVTACEMENVLSPQLIDCAPIPHYRGPPEGGHYDGSGVTAPSERDRRLVEVSPASALIP